MTCEWNCDGFIKEREEEMLPLELLGGQETISVNPTLSDRFQIITVGATN